MFLKGVLVIVWSFIVKLFIYLIICHYGVMLCLNCHSVWTEKERYWVFKDVRCRIKCSVSEH